MAARAAHPDRNFQPFFYDNAGISGRRVLLRSQNCSRLVDTMENGRIMAVGANYTAILTVGYDSVQIGHSDQYAVLFCSTF
jgi:hypothetical protein